MNHTLGRSEGRRNRERMMQIEWQQLQSTEADAYDGVQVEISGWWTALDPGVPADYGLMAPELSCCNGGAPGNPLSTIEVWLGEPHALHGRFLTLTGRWHTLTDDPAGWRYQLRDARPVPAPVASPVTALTPASLSLLGRLSRRSFLASGALLGLAACSPGRFSAYTEAPSTESVSAALPAGSVTIDIHSHAGRVIVSRNPEIGAQRPFVPVAAAMTQGGMHVICLAIVTDSWVTRLSSDRKRFEAFRPVEPGELYGLANIEFKRAADIVERDRLNVVLDAAGLRAAPHIGPSVIISAEGADFLEGQLDLVDEAYRLHHLRHLQLTHYRVNELGDIQTEAPVHGGLSDFGADVVRRCNTLGVVVDVAHGTYDLVKRAAAVSSKPLVLSHTSLADHPGPRSRQISADHARVIAGTGGVIGVWPNANVFADLNAMAEGVRQLAEVVGVEHVGLGSDMLGFVDPPVFNNYRQLPQYASALQAAGFTRDEVGQILGGNYLRVFEASLA